jgi:glycosyltransferase involved in cell wall biosynthesis
VARIKPAMKILFATYSHNVHGGIEIWLDGLARFLEEREWDVTIALAKGVRYNRPERYRAEWPGHHFVEIDGRTGTNEGRIRAATHVIEEIRPDVIVPVTLGHALAAAGRLKVRGSPVRLVLPIHATSSEILREALAFAPVLDRCIGVNPLHAEALVQNGFPQDRTATVINGATPPRTAVTRAREPGSLMPILFAGRVHDPTKRVFDLPVIAAELLRRGVPFTFTIAGDGPDLGGLRAKVEAGGLNQRFEFLGWVEQDRLRDEIMPQHDVMLITSAILGEAAPPLVALEAMAAGCVPVSSEFVGVHAPGSIRDRDTALLFECGNVDAAASRIEELFRDHALWQRLSDNSLRRARLFTLHQSQEKWDAALRTVVAEPPLKPPASANFPFSARDRKAGRLDAGGLPPAITEVIRRLTRRFPSFDDGWGEWPGTVVPESMPVKQFDAEELGRIDRQLAKSSVLA